MLRRKVIESTHRELTIAICGNPNCGKTTLFNALTGLNQRVGNYPGVTVEKTTGTFEASAQQKHRFRLVDTPGSFSLSAFSPDEYVATRVLGGDIEGEQRPDIVLCVIDATNLERGLYLLFQVIQVKRPVVVALNMVDVAVRHGIEINIEKLSKRLEGIAVVPVVASKRKGIDQLKKILAEMADNPRFPQMETYDPLSLELVQNLAAASNGARRTDAEYLRLLYDRGGPAEKSFIKDEGEDKRALLEEYRDRIVNKFGALSVGETFPLTNRASSIANDVLTKGAVPSVTKSERLDHFLLHPFLGPLFLLAVMVFMFQSVFSWAQPAMEFISTVFGTLGEYVESNMSKVRCALCWLTA